MIRSNARVHAVCSPKQKATQVSPPASNCSRGIVEKHGVPLASVRSPWSAVGDAVAFRPRGARPTARRDVGFNEPREHELPGVAALA